MATTAIVAEIVIVGLEAAAWIALLLVTVAGTRWIGTAAAALKGWEGLATILLLAIAYILGIIIDRAADSLNLELARLWPPRPIDKPADILPMRTSILREGGGIATFLDYQRSRMRIARSTAFNLLLATPVIIALLARIGVPIWQILVAAALLVLALVIVVGLYRQIDGAYVLRLSDAYRTIHKLPKIEIAAAIPYRTSNGELQFLLVRTSDGRQWTFPKGHRKPGETLSQAAEREAAEEAGIRGSIQSVQMAQYPYPPTRPWEQEGLVAGYLLKAGKQTVPLAGQEAKRQPTWLSFEQAIANLGVAREPKYASAMTDVLTAAARSLGQELDY